MPPGVMCECTSVAPGDRRKFDRRCCRATTPGSLPLEKESDPDHQHHEPDRHHTKSDFRVYLCSEEITQPLRYPVPHETYEGGEATAQDQDDFRPQLQVF